MDTDSAAHQFGMTEILCFLAASSYYVAMVLNLRQIQIAWTRKTYKRQNTSSGIFLANLGRFAIWVCIGTLLLSTDPTTGWLFILTRGVGACMMVVNLALKDDQRPPIGRTLARVAAVAAGLTLVHVLLRRLPNPAALMTVLYVLLGLTFVYSFLVIIQQIVEILKHQRQMNFNATKGMTRRFQWGMLFNYVTHFAYGLVAEDPRVRSFMFWAYTCILVPQAVLVLVIESALRHDRAERQAELPTTAATRE